MFLLLCPPPVHLTSSPLDLSHNITSDYSLSAHTSTQHNSNENNSCTIPTHGQIRISITYWVMSNTNHTACELSKISLLISSIDSNTCWNRFQLPNDNDVIDCCAVNVLSGRYIQYISISCWITHTCLSESEIRKQKCVSQTVIALSLTRGSEHFASERRQLLCVIQPGSIHVLLTQECMTGVGNIKVCLVSSLARCHCGHDASWRAEAEMDSQFRKTKRSGASFMERTYNRFDWRKSW